jgi:Amt family ammonium transporter
VDDALGVVHTHGVAGLIGGLMVGILGDSSMIVYFDKTGKTAAFSVTGGGHQLWLQLGAALTVIIWDGALTFVILKLIGLVVPLRLPAAALETGDLYVHGEQVSGDLEPSVSAPGHAPAPGGSTIGALAGTLMTSSTRAAPPPTDTR